MITAFQKSDKPMTMIVASTELSNEELRNRSAIVQKILDDAKLNFEFFISPKSHHIEVSVRHGDWKHDHGHLDYIMEKNGYMKLGEKPFGEPSDDDSYSSVHIYFNRRTQKEDA